MILSHGQLKGGSLLTLKFAEKYEKPFLHIDFNALEITKAVEVTRKWLDSVVCKKINIAGPRASEDAKIYEAAKLLLQKLYS